ncbi:heat shock protein-like protein [Strigomonas culicis]|uniref:Heat shock protein-like protein n=1 Tax=Strigomonas culicis TaxID=28005 RepID=S9VTW6_9TRYP|nr:heat shock protein-like protein [Strigomonas culicis]EPY26655.1 heat shock protein-like protein [Strigomonas culicis]|eukprot:EPY23058.1 heat shock protein-like protein [Strigomonas culicis]
MTDFYEVLGLARLAEDDEIAKAYRRYAMAYNPKCHLEDPNQKELMQKFKLVGQAYTVLSQPKVRAIYDQYGEEGVRHGGTGNQGIPGGLDLDSVDPNRVFETFFGLSDPFQQIGAVSGVRNNQHDFFSTAAVQPTQVGKFAPLLLQLPITLEDVFYGATRKVTWSKQVTAVDGGIVGTVEAYEVQVPKGAATGDVITLAGRGNSTPVLHAGDVLVQLELQPHKTFRREGDDLVVAVPITLTESLCGTTVTVTTMEGRALPILIDEIVHPKYRTTLKGEGLPSHHSNGARGDLIVEYIVNFPGFLTLEQKSELRRILDAQ